MCKLLIVEDELWFREVLVRTIPWGELGITSIMEADNGQEALSITRSEPIDIILSDIRMPKMDGLQLLRQVKDQHSHIDFVMLTGYDDFEYVRTAMRLEAFDYLLKPVDDEELKALFRRLLQARREKQMENLQKLREQTELHQSRSMLKEQCLKDWFTGKWSSQPMRLDQKLEEAGILWVDTCYRVISAELDRSYALVHHYSERDCELFLYCVRNIIEEYVQEAGLTFEACILDQRVCLWMAASMDEKMLMPLMERIRSDVRTIIKTTISIGVSDIYEDKHDVPQAHNEAVYAIKMRLYSGPGKTHFYKHVDFNQNPSVHLRSLKEFKQTLSKYLLNGDKAKALHLLDDLFREIKALKVSLAYLNHTIASILQSLWETVDLVPQTDLINVAERIQLQDMGSTLDTLDEIQEQLAGLMIRIADGFHEARGSGKHKLIQDILFFLNEHYMKDITLHSLAEQFYVNPSYLSRLFKEETGLIFTRYLMHLRLEQAKHLLDSTYMKVYEISQSVGYEDVKYFNKIFKDATGFTPIEYRNK